MEGYFKYKDINIFFYDSEFGNNTIVLIHGYLENHNMWSEYTDYLKSDYRIITLDLPGHGKSDFCEGLTMEMITDIIHNLLTQQGVSKHVIIGHSLGGYISSNYSVKYTDNVLGLGFFHSHAGSDNEKTLNRREVSILKIEQNKESYINDFISSLFSEKSKIIYKEKINNLVLSSKLIESKVMIDYQRIMMNRKDSKIFLSNFKHPVFYITGKEDKLITKNIISEQWWIPTVSNILVLTDVSHMGHIEDFNKTSLFIRCFLNTCF